MGKKVIIDTDPGCDDILALLYALASGPEDIEVLLISVTFGNVDAQSCLRNVLSMFHVIEKEISWRVSKGLSEGFTLLKKTKPIVAVGAAEPLGQRKLMADYFHGLDGLGNVHETHPHHSAPLATGRYSFENPQAKGGLQTGAESVVEGSSSSPPTLFTPSNQHSVDVILSLLSSHPPDTITLIAIGPLTNYATAASRDVSTFLRAKHLLVMGGAIDVPGNITPMAEFNSIADPVAAATVYALTSPKPTSTMPPQLNQLVNQVTAVHSPQTSTFPPPRLAKPLSLILFPLDITTPHVLTRGELESILAPLTETGSPLAEWVSAFMEATFKKTENMYNLDPSHQSADSDIKSSHAGPGASKQRSSTAMSLHDLVPIWYAIEMAPAPSNPHRIPTSSPTHNNPSLEEPKGAWQITDGIDIRVETSGQWTRGMHVRDRRGVKLLRDEIRESFEQEQQQQQQLQRGRDLPEKPLGAAKEPETAVLQVGSAGSRDEPDAEVTVAAEPVEISGDHGNWLQRDMGNRVHQCVGTPGHHLLARAMLEAVFGSGRP